MERKQQKSSIILKYNKRRFDGGSEVEQIRQIEYKQAVAQLDKLYNGQPQLDGTSALAPRLSAPAAAPSLNPVLPVSQPVAEPLPELNELNPVNELTAPPLPEETRHQKRLKRVQEALLMGPLELCVGMVGMLTALLALLTFSRMKNEKLVGQSKAIFKDCLKTFNKGLLDTVAAPVKALKAAVKP